MKFNRVEAMLPIDVSLRINERTAASTFTKTTEVRSNIPIFFVLDVPEGATQDTARVLRAMADDLEKP